MTSDILILGTDTDAGKTALSVLWLALLADEYEFTMAYAWWKNGRAERAAVADLIQVEGISAETARRIYEFFHEGAM